MKRKERKSKLYLAHAISIRKEVREWELTVEKKYDIELINPFYDLGELKRMKLIDNGDITPYTNVDKRLSEEIVNDDLKAINDSDGIVAYIKQPSIGTSMEIYHCKQLLMKPVYIYLEDVRYLKHPWLMKFSDSIYTSLDSLNIKLGNLHG